jgi:hypothetical protein
MRRPWPISVSYQRILSETEEDHKLPLIRLTTKQTVSLTQAGRLHQSGTSDDMSETSAKECCVGRNSFGGVKFILMETPVGCVRNTLLLVNLWYKMRPAP